MNLAIAFVLVIIVLVTVGVALFQLIRASQAHQQPDPQMLLALLPKLALLMLIMLPFAMFYGWVMLLAIPRAMLGNVPGMTAIRDAVSAVMANLLPLIVNFLCLMLVMFIVFLIMLIPLMLLGALQQHSFFLSMLIQIPVMAIFTGGILALYCAIMFQAWREVFGEETMPPPVPPSTFAA
jgi:hypothetical protein